jgi:phosphoadenosine phosphosulfate reductase
MPELITRLNEYLTGFEPVKVIAYFTDNYPGKVTFSTSLGAEDQVIVQMLASNALPVKIFTLDTGRLFQETYDLLDITCTKYQLPVDVYMPDPAQVEEMVRHKGINLFYHNVENRRLCCELRKIEPLKRALSGMEVWITGMRKEQSVTRQENALVEWDQHHAIIKVNPLINWTKEQVWGYISEHHIPVNELHARGYPSIGCSPCTRAVGPGESERSGRWWWELPEFRECGLHKKGH